MNRPVIALVVAAGRGTRFSEQTDAAKGTFAKQYVDLDGVAIIRRTVDALIAMELIDHVQCVIHPDDHELYESVFSGLLNPRLLAPVDGGATRQDSVRSGLEQIAHSFDDAIVLIHDGVRPFIRRSIVTSLVDVVRTNRSGAVPCLEVTDTLKTFDNGLLCDGPDRGLLRAVQTPQAFPLSAIMSAHEHAAREGQTALTDDAAVFSYAGGEVRAVAGDKDNIKITHAGDLQRAQSILTQNASTEMATPTETRTGIGYDLHRLVPGDGVILCGITLPYHQRLSGHSDADIALHALTDAILGTMGEGDIGSHFPPSDPQWKGASSDQFIQHAVELLRSRGGRLIHCDMTIIGEAPKVGPHREAMRDSLSTILGVSKKRLSVKATTNEKVGAIGRMEALACLATATVELPALDDEELG